jgi:hypothetical protein
MLVWLSAEEVRLLLLVLLVLAKFHLALAILRVIDPLVEVRLSQDGQLIYRRPREDLQGKEKKKKKKGKKG